MNATRLPFLFFAAALLITGSTIAALAMRFSAAPADASAGFTEVVAAGSSIATAPIALAEAPVVPTETVVGTLARAESKTRVHANGSRRCVERMRTRIRVVDFERHECREKRTLQPPTPPVVELEDGTGSSNRPCGSTRTT